MHEFRRRNITDKSALILTRCVSKYLLEMLLCRAM